MLTDKIVLAVFTGTGNTLLAAERLAERLKAAGKSVRIVSMDKPGSLAAAQLDPDATLGLAVPVACFTTYPTVWRWLDILPAGGGRGVFFLATMGGMGAGMQGPVGRALAGKGYRLLAAATVAMCGNYGNGAPQENAREAVFAQTRAKVDRFAEDLLAGRGNWSQGRFNPLSAFLGWLGREKHSFRFFRRIFTATVNRATCTGCRLCVELCPEQAIAMQDGKAAIGAACQSCQRCVGICPVGAIGLPGKPVRQYRALPPGKLQDFFKGKGA